MMRYKLLLFNGAVALLVSLFLVFVGTDSITDIMARLHFISDLLVSLILVFVLLSLISEATRMLESRYAWQNSFSKRIFLQAILGVLFPLLLVVACLYIYFFLVLNYHYSDVEHFLYTELPVSVLIIISINIAYTAYFFYLENKQHKKVVQTLEQQLYTLQNLQSVDRTLDRGQSPIKIKTLIAVSGNKNIPITTQDICYFYKDGNYTQVKTFQSKTFLLNHTLDELIKLLEDDQFFRVNRQFIVNRKACHYFTNEENGKLELFLTPEHNQEVIISQKRSAAFKEWLNQ